MSLCLITMIEDKYMAIGADSRCSCQINGEHHRVDDSSQKVHLIGDKIIFASGNANTIENIILLFLKEKEQTVNRLQDICINLNKSNECVNVCVAYMEKGKPVLYHMSSKKNNFELKKNECDFGTKIFTAGFKDEEANKLATDYLKKGVNITISDLYKYVYESLADETIGGTLTIYELTPNGITKQDHKIQDRRKIRTACNLSYFDANGNLIMDHMGTITWNKLPSSVANVNQIPTSPGDIGALPVGALPGYIKSTYIDHASIESPTITGGTITGGTIIGGSIGANTTINVGTDLTVGNRIYLNPSSSGNKSIILEGEASINFSSQYSSLILSARNGVQIQGVYFRSDGTVTGLPPQYVVFE